MTGAILAAVGVAALGLALGLVLSFIEQKLAVAEDETFYNVRSLLPGINCGACGYAGCDDYARNVLTGAATNLCKPGGPALADKLSAVMGREALSMEEVVAAVHCQGTTEATTKIMEYEGPQTCEACNALYRGHGECSYGCLGFGDCKAACEFGALEIEDGVAVINRNLCVACGKCINACPKRLIELVPKKTDTLVTCSSCDKGGVTRKVCKVGCIACKRCEKACEYDAIKVIDNLAIIDYDLCTNCGSCIEVCPTNAVRKAPMTQWERELGGQREPYMSVMI